VCQVPRILPRVLPFLSMKTMWLSCHQNRCPFILFVSTATHLIRESALTPLSHCQSFREICSYNSLATECVVRSYSTATFPRVAATLPFLESAPTQFVLITGCICLSAQPPIIFGNTLPHIMVSHILGSASLQTLCLFINTATTHHCISLSQMSV